jgi:N-acetylmuramoyl-L-alanine amidase
MSPLRRRHGGLSPDRPVLSLWRRCGMRLLLTAISLLWGLSVTQAQMQAQSEPQAIEPRYQLAVAQFYQVQHETSGSVPERVVRWQAVAQTFQRIHRDAPADRRGADAEFSAAIALREAWLLSQKPEDASAALTAFRSFTSDYPDSSWSDDSLMHQAAILESQPNGSQEAYALYRKVAMRTPPGREAALARSRLNALLREQRTQDSGPETAARAPEHKADASSAAIRGTAGTPVVLDANAGATPPSAKKSGPAQLRRLQVLSALQFTRIIVTTDRPVKPKVEQTAGDVGQLRLGFKRTESAASLVVPPFSEDGILKGAKFVSWDKKGTQLVLDVGALDRYDIKTFELPVETKLVVDLYPRKAGAATANAGNRKRTGSPSNTVATRAAQPVAMPPADAMASDGDRLSLKASLGLKVRSIMLDPGHGGHDPGAVAFGVEEKDLALEIAQRLRAILQKRHPDVRVGMTRNDDRFIPLGQRPKLAKAFGADLFVSIHLNASPAEKLQGVETYFLNLTSDATALRVAARENATSEKKVSDLNVILLDLLRDTNILESSRLAQALHTELVDTLRVGTPVHDLGVKQAPFMVLIGAEMPSVLVEAGFVTNAQESDRLKSDAYLDKIATGIYAGLDKYISNEDIAQAKPRSRLFSHITD